MDETTNPERRVITSGIIAASLSEPIHRVLNILNTRLHIQPIARAGTLRLYKREAIAQVRHELNAIDARRNAQSGQLEQHINKSKIGDE